MGYHERLEEAKRQTAEELAQLNKNVHDAIIWYMTRNPHHDDEDDALFNALQELRAANHAIRHWKMELEEGS